MHNETLVTKLYKTGFPKVGQYRYSGGQEQQRGKRGAMSSKKTTGGP